MSQSNARHSDAPEQPTLGRVVDVSPPQRNRPGVGYRALLLVAAGIVVIAGLKAATSIIVPVLASAMIAVLCIPAVNRLQSWKLPEWAAVAIVFGLVLVTITGLSLMVGGSVSDFREEVATEGSELDKGLDLRRDELAGLLPESMRAKFVGVTETFDVKTVLGVVGKAAGAVADLLSNTFFVLLTVAFILFEAAGFSRKLAAAFGGGVATMSRYDDVVTSVRDYIRIKAWLSLATGVLAGILCAVLHVRYPVLWAVAAFLLNFVPTIGSMVAAVPPVLLAYVQFGWEGALAVAIGYVVINTVIGNVLEPRMMGRRLGLSSLVVWLSLVFWGWVWGPIGMLLSVPLTMIVKILLEHSDDLRWVAVLLGPAGGGPPEKPLPTTSKPSPRPTTTTP